MAYNNKAKLKEQNGSRLTNSTKGLAITKGKGLGRVGEKGGRKGLRGTIINTYNIGRSLGRQYSRENQLVTLYHLTTLTRQRLQSVGGGSEE